MKSMGSLLKLWLPYQYKRGRATPHPIDTQIVAMYCICEDILKELQLTEDNRRQMSDTEVMTTSICGKHFLWWKYGKI
jgi:hypothetical protein